MKLTYGPADWAGNVVIQLHHKHCRVAQSARCQPPAANRYVAAFRGEHDRLAAISRDGPQIAARRRDGRDDDPIAVGRGDLNQSSLEASASFMPRMGIGPADQGFRTAQPEQADSVTSARGARTLPD